jgi:UV DNA damage endonuclease
MKYGLCCISLNLQELDEPVKFQTMTYKRFSSLSRDEALSILGDRILNNMYATNEIIQYCAANGFCYRLSSDLFPLITYDEANVDLENLPNYDDIEDSFDLLEETIASTNVRISCHPSEFNVLASTNNKAVEKTITELNFYSSFMDRIGCPADYRSPMNLHIHNKDGDYDTIISRFLSSYTRLDSNCRNRLVIENDDKVNCWSVKELTEIFFPKTSIPITFDYLHHTCHPDTMSEEEAIRACHATWKGYKPLFHYSESRPGNNPRAHADYAYKPFNTYNLDFDIDFELKMKDKAISQHIKEQPCMTMTMTH